jgi:hypothetical protein
LGLEAKERIPLRFWFIAGVHAPWITQYFKLGTSNQVMSKCFSWFCNECIVNF